MGVANVFNSSYCCLHKVSQWTASASAVALCNSELGWMVCWMFVKLFLQETLEKQQESLKKQKEAVKYRLKKLASRQLEIAVSCVRTSYILP